MRDGKSTHGEVCHVAKIDQAIHKIAKEIQFIGAINFQAFLNQEDELYFIEVNPRLGGGSALAFAATENWINLMIDNLIAKREIQPKPIAYGLKMARSYREVFF